MTTLPDRTEAQTVYRQKPYYDRDVDFDRLAKADPAFAAIVRTSKKRGFIDFQDPAVVQQLTLTLLRIDFSLTLTLPPDRLCPPVPVRWNYIRWLQDLIDTTNPLDSFTDLPDPARAVAGLDIGTGASAIYALLACATRPRWRMRATDVDGRSLTYARRNVAANGLGERIEVREVAAEEPLVPEDNSWDFVMTNPPFFSSEAEARGEVGEGEGAVAVVSKRERASAVCTGAVNEMIYADGGDLGFATRLLEQSLVLRERVGWYSAMMGRLSSAESLVTRLTERGVDNVAVTDLQAGYKTKRWAVAWSFRDRRPRNDVIRHGELTRALLVMPTAQTIKVPLQSARWAGKKVDEAMRALNVQWEWRPLLDTGVMQCKENVWSRAARRKRKFAELGNKQDANVVQHVRNEGELDHDSYEGVVLAVKIVSRDEEVEARWLRGHDQLIFTSFCGMLKTALSEKKS